MLIDAKGAGNLISSGKTYFVAGDEKLLAELPKGNWIGGTIPYFMAEDGGVIAKDRVFITEAPLEITEKRIRFYDDLELSGLATDAYENGFTVIIIPALSPAHVSFAKNAPAYPDIFLHPVIGWISGVHLDNIGKVSPKVFNGMTGESTSEKAVVLHAALPANKLASIAIVNLFRQGRGDSIVFQDSGFSVKDCLVNGVKTNLAQYMDKNKVDVKLPLVANYSGAMVNVSFQNVSAKNGEVDFYAPVFAGTEYKIAEPVGDYIQEFGRRMPSSAVHPAFSCNCILNFLYSRLEGKKAGSITGPVTFGEIAYQLLNQTMVYMEIKDK